MNLWLFAGVAALAAWVVLTFLLPAGVGAVHILLGVGLVALVVWWARRYDGKQGAVSGKR